MTRFNQPLGGNEMPRFAGPGSLFRLPEQPNAAGLDIALAGVPLDVGTSNRPGARFGPRAIRAGERAGASLRHAYGRRTVRQLSDRRCGGCAAQHLQPGEVDRHHRGVLRRAVEPGRPPGVHGGGPHHCAADLRALARRHGPVALVHVDAHADINEAMFGEPITHGTIFRRALEEGLVQGDKMTQIGPACHRLLSG